MLPTLTYQRIQAYGRFSFGSGQFVPGGNLPVEIEQLGSGRTLLYLSCDAEHPAMDNELALGAAMWFVGDTDDGLPIRTSDLWYLGRRSDRHCFSASMVTVGDVSRIYDSIELAVTNVDFGGEGRIRRELSLDVSVDDSTLPVQLSPAENFDDLIFQSRQTACPAVTAKLRLTPGNPSMENLDSLVNDLCTTLSVVQARKVQWIHRTAFCPQGNIVWSEFGATKTKAYSPGMLCVNPSTGRGIRLDIADAQVAFPKVRQFRQAYDPNHRIVNAWLDARLEDPFLEARTLQYAIVLEALCRLVEAKHDEVPSGRVPKGEWRLTGKKFLPLIRDHLRTLPGVDPHVVENVCSSNGWGNLNRASFATTLAECLSKLGIAMHDGPNRIRRVTAIRNKIVHNLKYLSEDDFREHSNWPVIDPKQQHFLVACFVEELLLRLFGLGDLLKFIDGWPVLQRVR